MSLQIINQCGGGYTRYEGEKGGWYDLCKNPPKDWYTNNKPVVETLVKEGYKIKVIPTLENIQEKYKTKWSNPDVFIDGFLSDIKEPKAMNSNAIKSRIKSAHEQGLTHVIVNIPDTMPESSISRAFNRYRGEKHSYSINVLWIYKGMINTLSI